MPCGNCGTELLPGKNFCHACGTPLQAACRNCGETLNPEFRFCPECGTAAGEVAATSSLPAREDPPESDPLQRHLPEGLASKIRRVGAVAGERKRATVLFCDLVGSTAIAEGLDPEEYRELLDQFLEIAFGEIYRHEGIVNQLAGDGFMALFGAPITHEDDPERAVRAALGIQKALEQLHTRVRSEGGVELTARIGIHTGTVVVGTMGNDLKTDYTAIGDTTNLAARLQSLASPGSILISEATSSLVRGHFRTKSVGPLEVKGKSEPINAQEIIEIANATPMGIAKARGLTPLFGREPEIAQLMGCFSRLDDRLAQVVSIVGDAGSGKSRLIYEFKKRLADEEVHVLEGRCSSLTRGVPYTPWKMMMRGLFKLENEACGPAEAERVCCCVEEMLGVEHAEIAPHLCSMLSLPQPTPIAPVEKVKQPWFGAVASLVGRMAKQKPVVMILEDLHWIDDASLEMLEMAVAACNTEAIMVVVTHRPDFQPQWQSQAASTQLHLRLLSPEHARQIVRARVGGELPASLEDRILKKGEGNPFFLEELTRGLMEEGAFVASEGRVEVTRPVESIRIPDTVQELLGARLDRLEPGAKRVAQIASVFGRQFKGDQLRELVADGGNGIDVASELAELEQRGVIHRSGLASDQFRFGESLTQEVAYEGLLLRERRQLHAQVGQMLLRSTEGSDGSSLALIGHHLARSEEREKGLLTLLEAADQALDMPSYGDAIRLYLECWELADSAVEESHNGDGKLREAALRAVLGYLQVAMIFGESRAQKVEHAIARGLELAQELDDADAIASIHGLRGTILMNSDRERFNDGIALIEKGVEVARNAGLERRVAQLSRSLSWAYLGDGLFQEARRSIDEVFKTLERLGEGGAHSDTYLGARFFENRILIESDHYSEARASLQETFELASSGSNRTIETASAAQLSTVYFRLGEYEQAERMAEHGMEVSQEIDSPAATRTCSIVQLGIRFLRDPSSIALAELDRFDTRLDSGSDVSQNLDLIIELLLGIGEVERAGQLAQKGVERSGGRLRDARNLLSVGRVASRRGPAHAMSAQKHLLKALEIAREIGIRSVIAHALIALAELAELRGETPDRASLEEARGIFEDLKLKHYAPRVRSLLEAN